MEQISMQFAELMTLDELIASYKKIQLQEEELAAKKSELKDAILASMAASGEKKHSTPEGISATIAEKIGYEYPSQDTLIKVLTEQREGAYIQKTINKTSLNSALKKDESLFEFLNTVCEGTALVKKTTSHSLTVK